MNYDLNSIINYTHLKHNIYIIFNLFYLNLLLGQLFYNLYHFKSKLDQIVLHIHNFQNLGQT